ncbi:glycoside hydrolase family 13 [Micractinium conductrix]|uniref:Alpha-amylase n=1 Tax=Micractinium conductrix TaxID=554055 RepID=A0A2P6V4L9_9CHLO|nr:glycoside hydrolase family 13 [Micractinium conductrix]|eukprot:PSC69027.1 glycoside hydrolase family 13 [Micractinium conductrix]
MYSRAAAPRAACPARVSAVVACRPLRPFQRHSRPLVAPCRAFVEQKQGGAPGKTSPAPPAAAAAAAPTAADPVAASAFQRPPRIPPAETIVMEGFGWESCKGGNWWKVVEGKIPALQAAGITHLWLPPPSQSVSPQGYLPGQLYNLNSKYGTQEELLSLNRKLLEAGIRPVADVVINHRCAQFQDENGTWNRYGDDVTHQGKKINWDKWAITCDDPVFEGTGGKDSGDDYPAAPDLDHHNRELRDSLVDWLNWLHKDMGFEGWRFDFVRGYASEYCREYMERTIGDDVFHVGENFVDLRWEGSHLDYNQDAARQKLVDYIKGAKHTTMFDFVTKGILQEAVKNTEYDRLRDGRGKAPGLLGWWPDCACTFVDNHDTGSTQQHWPFPRSHVMLGYAYILTHPGVPCLFWEHHFDWGLAKQIDKLVAVRKRAGIRADSKLEILAADKDMYVARCNGSVVIKLGPRFDMPANLVPRKEDGWELAASGQDFAVWEKKQ